jgi:hypothetical protein
MTFMSCSKDLPIWNPQFGGLEEFLMVSIKTPQALCSSISLENFINFGCGNFPLKTTAPILWEMQTMQTHTQAGKSLKGTTLIHLMFTKTLIHFDLRNTPAHTGYSQ